jgi:hypothetical protein
LGFFRREEPLHEKLAREGGLDFPRRVDEPDGLPTLDPEHPLWRIAGIHGIPRAREWDAVATAVAAEVPGTEVDFVALPDGTLYTDDDLPDGALAPLADALDGLLDAPYHAFARRQEEDVWSAAALRVDVVEVPEDVDGDQIDLVVNDDGERTILVDGAESRVEIPSLEDFAAQQFGSFVLRASRLDETLWEATVLPL